MSIKKLLIANRGEIAIRIARTAAVMDIQTAGIYAKADQSSKHCRYLDQALPLVGDGVQAYLDGKNIIALAKQAGCDAIHPGYGFLSESSEFAAAVAAAGLIFIGPEPEVLALYGNKEAARAFAKQQHVPVLPGIAGSLEQTKSYLQTLPAGSALMLKAKAGGGGRGMRLVISEQELEQAWPRCQSEAKAAFASDDLYAELYLPQARHLEVQVLGDTEGNISHLWERDCTIQRHFQKIMEIAPSPWLPETMRTQLIAAATTMARAQGIRSLATFEFLVSADYEKFFFIEANPRLQVEHTVTEAVTGVDLVAMQIQLAEGASLASLGLMAIPKPRGSAIEVRIAAETATDDGIITPTSGTVRLFEPATGPRIRVDTDGYAGCHITTVFDSLLAKLIVHDVSFDVALKHIALAIADFHITGVDTNLGLLHALVRQRDVRNGQIDNGWFGRHLHELLADKAATTAQSSPVKLAGAQLTSDDPLAILAHGKTGMETTDSASLVQPDRDPAAVTAPMQGTIVDLKVAPGDAVKKGGALLIMEAMKMEHVIAAPYDGVVQAVHAQARDTVTEGYSLLVLRPVELDITETEDEMTTDLDHIRSDLAEVLVRHAMGLDENRPGSVAKRRKTGHQTARENIAAICDPGSFVEYGPLVTAAQRKRRSLQDLIANTPADGMLAGLCSINGALFSAGQARCVLIAYDYTVLAGTQGQQNHRKKDRMFALAKQMRCPVVFFTEGGGGRPGDTDGIGIAGLDCLAFNWFAKLSALVPLVGITTGRCFAGNAALLGCCDVIIATEDANIGMGGPAMIEGGGLGVFKPEEIGPMVEQVPNGVVDLLVKDEAAAAQIAKKYLSYFQGDLENWEQADQRLLRTLIPENRLRIYDIRRVVDSLADTDSVLELRQEFGVGMITALARFEGQPVGIIANNPAHLAGAIDSNAADKATRFMQLCDAFDLPLLFLCDCPGIMVGPEAEKTALVRHATRMFVTAANLSVPFFTIVLRKAYGLGAQAMAGGSFKAAHFTVAWPTGEFGGMGLEGAVKLGYRKELAAIESLEERRAAYQKRVQGMYNRGKAINAASVFEIDDVIDPVDSRRWIMGILHSAIKTTPRTRKKRPCIDTW